MQANQPSASPTGGRFSARVLAVVLALGVLGYLMWRSQAGHKSAPEGSPGAAPAVGEVGDDPAKVHPSWLGSSKSAMIEELPAPAEGMSEEELRLASSKSLVIEPDSLLPKPRAPEGQNPTASPAETTPAPETPR